MKLLITSVGSLLGQNILDSIETRRDIIEVVGTNSIAANQRNFRCDTVYLVPNTESPDFSEKFMEIINQEKPDFILPGRDEDCIFLSGLKSKDPEYFKNRIPFGSSFIPKIMFDKYQSYLFCKENNLPFAETFLYKSKKDETGLNEFIEKHGFPLMVKPKEGFASSDVYFLFNRGQVRKNLKTGEKLFQEYLGHPENLSVYKNIFLHGLPLFFQLPEEEQYAAQTIIAPDGGVGEIFITVNTMIYGRAEYGKQIFNRDVEDLVKQFCKAFYKHGWYGPVNFQLKPDKNGQWKVFELNPRMTGTTSGRVLLGYDEFGILAGIFAARFKIPNLTKKKKVKGVLIKYLSDNLLLEDDIKRLQKDKIWKRS